MDAQDIRNLSEAYMEVYDELDEAAKRSPKKGRGSKDTKSYQDGRSQAGMMVSGDSQVSGAGYMRRGGGKQTQTDPNERQPQQGRMDPYTRDEMEYRKARLKKEETDLYDIILSHLIDEGYAETPEAAEAIMVNMSEEWREDIVEFSQTELNSVSSSINQNTRNASIRKQQPGFQSSQVSHKDLLVFLFQELQEFSIPLKKSVKQ